MKKPHSFHIPVMGIGFTLDTPLKVAQYGMDSVISLVDDILMEKLRMAYCGKYQMPYYEITDKTEDFRAKRITSYLNLINTLVENKIEELVNSANEKKQEIKDYFNMLPDGSQLKQEFKALSAKYFNLSEIKNWISEHLKAGSIDVNIMTKIDKDNYIKNEKLPIEYNDAHAALRGYALSDLSSSIIFSAGMNPSLYSYIEQFEDFFPNEKGEIKKKIVLKVSDYRSAFIQGRFLAKKGLWVSEYRVESGLNCGGHAFATDGFLLGPILAEFRDNREALKQSVFEMLQQALVAKGRLVPDEMLPLRITAQGGVGTAEEHQFLLDQYGVDSVGWGTPFLLVPEVTMVDDATREKLIAAKEEDLYLSDISPLGVPFYSLRSNTKDVEKRALIAKGRPGSSCPKKYLSFNSEFTEKTICTASRSYQYLKLKQLDTQNLPDAEYQKQFDKITEKACLCVGLGTAALLVNNIDTKTEGPGVSICPGPNMAYFSKRMSLREITDHIYGRTNVITRTDRPHMFIKELTIYIDYLRDKIRETPSPLNVKQTKHLVTFTENLKGGINYYRALFSNLNGSFSETRTVIQRQLDDGMTALRFLAHEIERRQVAEVVV